MLKMNLQTIVKRMSVTFILQQILYTQTHIYILYMKNIEFSVTLICSIAYQHNAQVEIAQFAIPYFQSTKVVCD